MNRLQLIGKTLRQTYVNEMMNDNGKKERIQS
jgi:hypothetical protein